MANLKISQLPTAATATTADLLAIVNGGVTSKITLEDVAELTAFGVSGNTSGTCISNIFVSNVNSCSPLNIYDAGQKVATFEYANGFQLVDGVDMVIPSNSEIIDSFGNALLSSISTTNIQNSGGVSSTAVNFWGTNDLPSYTERISGTTTGATATTRYDKILDIENNYKTESLYKVIGSTPSIKSQISIGYDKGDDLSGMFYTIGGGTDNLNSRGSVCTCISQAPNAWGVGCIQCKDNNSDNASVRIVSYLDSGASSALYTVDAALVDEGVYSTAKLHSDYSALLVNQTLFSIDSSSGSDKTVIKNNKLIIDNNTSTDIVEQKQYNTTDLTINDIRSGSTSAATATTIYNKSFDLINGYKTESIYKFISGNTSATTRTQITTGYDKSDLNGMFYQIPSGIDSLNQRGLSCFCAGHPKAWGMHCIQCKSADEDTQMASVTLNSYINEVQDTALYTLNSASVSDNVKSESLFHSDFTSQIVNQRIFNPDNDGFGESIEQNTRTFDLEYNLDYLTTYKPKAYTLNQTMSGESSGVTATTIYETSYDFLNGIKTDSALNGNNGHITVLKGNAGKTENTIGYWGDGFTGQEWDAGLRMTQTLTGTSTGVVQTIIVENSWDLLTGKVSEKSTGYWGDGFVTNFWGTNDLPTLIEIITGSTTGVGETIIVENSWDLLTSAYARSVKEERCPQCIVYTETAFDTSTLVTTETWTGATTASTATTINIVKEVDLLTAGYKTTLTRGGDPVVGINHIFTISAKETHLQNSVFKIDETNNLVSSTQKIQSDKGVFKYGDLTTLIPATEDDVTGEDGDMVTDGTYIYVKNGTWKRAELFTW